MKIHIGDDCVVIDSRGSIFANGDIVTVERCINGGFLCSSNNKSDYLRDSQLGFTDDYLHEGIIRADETACELKEQIEKLRSILENRKDRHPPINGQEVMDRRSGAIGYSCGEFNNAGHLKVSSSKNCRGSIMHFVKWDLVDVKIRRKYAN